MSKIDSIIFDLDGTLWSSAKAISEAWGLVLQKHENIEKKEVTEEELYSCMGLPMYDIAAKLFPSLAENIRNQLMDELCEFENGYLEKRGGVLYDGLEETLAQLQENYKLYIVSILKRLSKHIIWKGILKIRSAGEEPACQRVRAIRY